MFAVLLVLFIMFFIILNFVYRKTAYWTNKFSFQKNFIHLSETDFVDIVNLGSNPALYGFFYENIKGQNLSTGSQGLPMDFELLKCFHTNLNTGGIVLIPIMPFTSISQYIRVKPKYWSDEYYMKFASVLNNTQVKQLPHYRRLVCKLKFPLLFRPQDVIRIFINAEGSSKLSAAEQEMSAWELESDAEKWINGWMEEFDVISMDGFLDDKFAQFEKEGIDILRDMINFCLEKELKPVLLTIPMTHYLYKKFPQKIKQKLIVDFVNKANITNIPFFNYMEDVSFRDSSYYINSFFFNLRGRKLFTKRVLSDLGLSLENSNKNVN